MESEKITHPSFGIVSWSRGQGRHFEDLFGTSLVHNETITINIVRGVLERDLNRDWYYGDKQIIEIQLSPN